MLTIGPKTLFSTGLVLTLIAPYALSFLRNIVGINKSIILRFTLTIQSLLSIISLLTCFIIFRIYRLY